MPSRHRIHEMVRKEMLQLKRDPRLRRILFVAPVIQLIVFGYAVSTDVRNTSMFLVDHDQTRTSRELVATLTSSGYFRVSRSDKPEDLVAALDHGRAIVGLEIPRGFARDVSGGTGAKVQIVVDGTNSNVATVALGYAERIVTNFAAREAGVALSGVIDLRERAWFNPDLESRNYNVPGVMAVLVMLICLLLTSLAVVREREIGTLEQLMVSPLTRMELILGKAIPFGMIGLFDLVLVGVIAVLWFDVPFRGSLIVLFVASVLYIVCTLGIGLLLSTLSRTQQEAFLTTFLFFMPTFLLSGFVFPVTSMPRFFQWATLVNPVRHYLEIVRAVFLEGEGFGSLLPQHAALLVMGVAVMSLAANRFRKRLD